jgi:hypothetical protein
MPIVLNTTVRRVAGLRAARLDDHETVVLSPDLQHYFGLNGVASRVWELAATPRTVGSICGMLESEFDIDRATCEHEVTGLIENLVAESLFQVVDGLP